jgi:hypothetical protein
MRALGAAVAVGSLGLLLSYPYHMRYHYSVPAIGDHYVVPFLGVFLAFVRAGAAAWGVATAVRGRIRSLTLRFAWISIPLAPLPMALDTFREPTTDAVPAPPRIAEWTPPAGPVEVAVRVFEVNGFWRLGCVVFLALGVAWARRDHRWLRGTAVALVCYGGLHGAATTSFLHGMIFRPLVAALPGAVLFALGAVLAAGTESPDTDSTDDPRSDARATD